MPFSFVLDDRSRVIDFGTSLQRLVPEIEIGASVDQYFTIIRPRNGLLNAAYLRNLGNTGVVLRAHNGSSFQLQAVPIIEESAVLLAGTVQLSSVTDFESTPLTLRDFPCWERTVDHLFTLREMEKESEARSVAEELARDRALAAQAEARAALQKTIDGAILAAIKKDALGKEKAGYLRSVFTVKPGDMPHRLKW